MSVTSVPEAGLDTSEGPGRSFVKLTRGRELELVSPPGALLSTHELVGFGLLLSLLGSGAVTIGVAVAMDHGWTRLGWAWAVAFVGATVVGLLALLRLRLTSQHVRAHDGRIEAWLQTLGVRRRPVEGSPAELSFELVTRGELACLKLTGGAKSLYLHGAVAECRWLAAQLEHLPLADAEEQLICPACGGPAGTAEQLRDAGAIDCQHCHSGLVFSGRALALGPALLPETDAPASDPSARIHSEHREELDLWRFRALSRASPLTHWLGWCAVLVPPTLICVLLIWMILQIGRRADAPGLVIPLFAATLVCLGALLFGALCELFVPHEIVIDRATLRMKGPLGFGNMIWRSDAQAIPLSRLMELKFEGVAGAPTAMQLRTPSGSVSWRWQSFVASDDAWLRASICRALEARLAALGRSAVRQSGS